MEHEPFTCELTPLCHQINPIEKLAEILESIDSKNKDVNFCIFHNILEKVNLNNIDEPIQSYKKQSLLQIASRKKEATNYCKLLIEYGANPNGTGQRPPLFIAASYGCYQTLDYLINLQMMRDDSFLYKDQLGNNLLHILHNDCAHLVHSLIKKGVDINQTNRKAETPIHSQLKKNEDGLLVVEKLLKYIAAQPEMDKFIIDTKLNTRDMLLDKLKNQRDLIEIINHIPKKDPPSNIFQILYSGNREEFDKEIEKENVELSDGTYTLLQLAVSNCHIWAVRKLLQKDADPNKGSDKIVPPLHLAASRGYYEILQVLIKESQKKFYKGLGDNQTTPLHLLLKNWSKVDNKEGCLDLLLNLPGLDINAREPALGNTALHYATKMKANYAVKELLKRGAYIGERNYFKETPLNSIDPDTFEEFLNSCIEENEKNPVEDSYQICMDYQFLFRKCTKNINNDNEKPNKISPIDPENPSMDSSSLTPLHGKQQQEEEEQQQQQRAYLESDPLLIISQSHALRKSLKHPILSGFLYLKWQRIQKFFYFNLAFYTLFVLIACTYAICYYGDPLIHYSNRNTASTDNNNNNENHTIKICLLSVYSILTLLLGLRELFQLIVSKCNYFKSPENYLELAIIFLSFIIICCPITSSLMRRQFAAITILFCGVEMVLLIGRHPFLSIYIEMFKKVSWNFIRFLIWYLILIIAFALSFYILFRNVPSNQCDELINNNNNNTDKRNIIININNNNNNNNTNDTDNNPFSSVGHSMFKTIIMLTGEFDASDIPFECLSWPSYIMFILFVFLICIVLINLLNGLAVNDTKTIHEDAVLVSLTARVELIYYFESVIDQFVTHLLCSHKNGQKIKDSFNLNKLIPTNQIAILVNKNSRLILDLRKENINKINEEFNMNNNLELGFCCCHCCGGQSTCDYRSCCQQQLEKQILTDAQLIIKQKQQITMEQLDNKIKNLTTRFDENQKILNEILLLLRQQSNK